jgi:hypothetical protein
MKQLLMISLCIITLTTLCTTYQKTSNLSEDNLNYIRSETINGKLDFTKKLDTNTLYAVDRIVYNYKEMAKYMWGDAVCRLGISNAISAIDLYEDILKTKLTVYSKKAITSGFNNCGKSNQ